MIDTILVATSNIGKCYHCGKPVEFPDHNSCSNCRGKVADDLEPMKMWLDGEQDPEVFDG